MSEHDFGEPAAENCRHCGVTRMLVILISDQNCPGPPAPSAPPAADEAVAEAVRQAPQGFDAIDRRFRR